MDYLKAQMIISKNKLIPRNLSKKIIKFMFINEINNLNTENFLNQTQKKLKKL